MWVIREAEVNTVDGRFKCGLGWDDGGERVQWRDNPNQRGIKIGTPFCKTAKNMLGSVRDISQ